MNRYYTIEECARKIASWVESRRTFWPTPLSESEVQSAKQSLALWLQLMFECEELEMRFLQSMVALRTENPFLAWCQADQFRSLVTEWMKSPGIDETQRRLSRYTLLDEIHRTLVNFGVGCGCLHKSSQWIRSAIGDLTVYAEIADAIRMNQIDAKFPECLGMLGTGQAIQTLRDLAAAHPGTEIGCRAECQLAFLGEGITPLSLEQHYSKFHVYLPVTLALATVPGSVALEDLKFVLRTCTDTWIEEPFKTHPLLVDAAKKVGSLRKWMEQGVEQRWLMFPGRRPVI
jgi:hypothetical protein